MLFERFQIYIYSQCRYNLEKNGMASTFKRANDVNPNFGFYVIVSQQN